MKPGLLLLACAFLSIPPALEARTWHVRQNGTGDCTTIQAGIDSATAGDVVLVSPGTYYEHIVISARASGVRVESEMGPEQTVIDGYTRGRGVLIDSAGIGTALVGFTIQNCFLWGGGFPDYGVGIACGSSYALIEGNIIRWNLGTFDGDVAGILCFGGATTIRRNLIVNNSSEFAYGAIVLANDASIVEENTIAYNSSQTSGGIHTAGSSAIISRNVVAFNQGRGISCNSTSSVTLSCNDVWSNTLGNYYRCGPGQDDISFDPQFCNPSQGNFFLSGTSPCAYWPGCGQIGALGVGCSVTGVGDKTGPTWGKIKALYR